MMSSRNTLARFALAAMLVAAAVVAGCATPTSSVPTLSRAEVAAEAQKQRELVRQNRAQQQGRGQTQATRRTGDEDGAPVSYPTPAPQQQVRHVSQSPQDMLQRLYTVGFRILKGSTSLCPGHEGWHSSLLVGEHPSGQESEIWFISPDSNAWLAGLRAGDVIDWINGAEVPTGAKAHTRIQERLGSLRNTEHDIAFRRGGQPYRVQFEPDRICNYFIHLTNGEEHNAYADGENIYFTRGMMEFLDTDSELATVFAHELAHNAMRHRESKTQNTLIGLLLGGLADIAIAAGGGNPDGTLTEAGAQFGALAYSAEFELEADYVGLYAMALSGYDVNGTPQLWRKMAVSSPRSITMRSTHPTTPERFVALEKAVKEIEDKMKAGRPLVPEKKKKQ